MADAYTGEIRIFAGIFAPENWSFCDGRSLPINNNQALYSLLGTTWGGDGVNTFNLPDFRSRLVVGAATSTASGSNLTPHPLGSTGGTESVTLTEANMPAHNHVLKATSTTADNSQLVANAALAAPVSGIVSYIASTVSVTAQNFNAATVQNSQESGQPHENRMPCTAMNFIICLNGLYPVQQ